MVIEVIHANGLSDIINPSQIEGVAETKNSVVHSFSVYSHNTKWVINENDKIILSELNMNYTQVDSEISFDDFKSKIKGIMLDCQLTRM
jgi:hypothetical protein